VFIPEDHPNVKLIPYTFELLWNVLHIWDIHRAQRLFLFIRAATLGTNKRVNETLRITVELNIMSQVTNCNKQILSFLAYGRTLLWILCIKHLYSYLINEIDGFTEKLIKKLVKLNDYMDPNETHVSYVEHIQVCIHFSWFVKKKSTSHFHNKNWHFFHLYYPLTENCRWQYSWIYRQIFQIYIH
jgi:hypothetical protein